MSIVSGSPPAAPASMGGLSSAVEDLSVLPEMNSLRFDGSSYLSRTPTETGNQKTWTFSAWVKRTRISTSESTSLISSTTHGGYYDGITQFGFSPSDTFFVYYDTSTVSPSGNPNSSVFRDTSSFYHIVWSVDANNTSNSIYVNGSSLTLSLSPINYSYAMNQANQLVAIGRAGWTSARFFEGYLANIHFIDGQALDAESFGEWISDIWKPRPYTGDYGDNGFHLDFAGENMVYDSNGKLTQVLDASSNDNHWTAN